MRPVNPRVWLKSQLLWLWKEVPLSQGARTQILRILNPTFLVGAVALIQDERGRVLLLEHTYRTQAPWGLPGGWLKKRETPQEGLKRELAEETGMDVEVKELAAAEMYAGREVALLFRCHVLSGEFRPSEEATQCGYFAWDELPPLPANQRSLLELAKARGR
jgi:ADP-ribose pyrophosphatase YjhB (NUDIX family)